MTCVKSQVVDFRRVLIHWHAFTDRHCLTLTRAICATCSCLLKHHYSTQLMSQIMDDSEEMEIDPAIAAAMGFASFGAKPGQKRKLNDDGYVDPSIPSKASGSNTIPIRADKAPKSRAPTTTGTSSNHNDRANTTNVAKPVNLSEASL